MSDNSPWTSPAGPAPDAPGGSANPYGPAPIAPPAAGWTPPPKPGLIPLRPLDFGTIFGTTFQVLRRNPRPTFGAALLLNALVVVVAFGLTFGVAFFGVERAIRASETDAAAIEAGTIGLIIVTGIIAVALSLVAQALLQGVIVLEVSRGTLGEKRKLGELLRMGRGRWGALIGWTALLSLALVVAIVLLTLLVVALIVVGEVGTIVTGVLVAIGGGLGLAVLAVWLWIKLALVPMAIMLERLPLRAAIGRSWRLVRGHFWRTLGILILMTVLVQFASSAVSAPFSIAASFGGALVNPAGDDVTAIVVLIGANVLTIAVTIVAGAIGAVLLAAAAALVYIDIRMRTEGLDIDLQQHVEQAAAGTPETDNPYLRGAPAAGSEGLNVSSGRVA